MAKGSVRGNRARPVPRSAKKAPAAPKGPPKVWLYMVHGPNAADLSILDATGVDRWQANPNTRKGDLILMYRTAPYSDIAYLFVAAGNARRAKPTSECPWNWQIKITGGFRLPRAITLRELRRKPELKQWSFARQQQGAMAWRRDLREQGVWPTLREMLEDRHADLPKQFGPDWKSDGRRHDVFVSYVREDHKRAYDLASALWAGRIDAFFDVMTIRCGQKYDSVIERAIRNSKAFIICASPAWKQSRGYAKQEYEIAHTLAQRRKSFLFPVRIAACNLPRDLVEEKIHVVDLFGPRRKKNLEALVSHLGQMLKGRKN
jgi:hypothetical protein